VDVVNDQQKVSQFVLNL